jgi:antitoxin component of MazEF toxin-antitoxin module
MPAESLVGVVHAGTTSGGKSMIVVVPKAIRKMLSIEKGARFAVSVVGDKRIVYDLLEEAPQ